MPRNRPKAEGLDDKMIACGHCKKQHATVAEVRDCARVNPPKEIDLTIPSPPVPTEFLDMHRKVMEVFADNKLAQDRWPNGEMAPEGFYRLPVYVKLDSTVCEGQDPFTACFCSLPGCGKEIDDEHKVYYDVEMSEELGIRFGGETRCSEHEYDELVRTRYDYVKVQLNQSGTRRYAKRLHVVQELVEGTIQVTSATWEFEPGLMSKIRPSHILTEEQAAEFGKLYGWCCICGRRLTNEESIARGIGPVCAGKQGW